MSSLPDPQTFEEGELSIGDAIAGEGPCSRSGPGHGPDVKPPSPYAKSVAMPGTKIRELLVRHATSVV